MEWIIWPTLWAFLLSLIFIWALRYPLYLSSKTGAELISIMFLKVPALLLLFIAIRVRKYALEDKIITAKRFL